MIDIIYKTVKLSHLKKLQIIQNMKNLMFQVIFIFSDWILIKQIIVSSTSFCCSGIRFSKEWCLGQWVFSFCPERDDKNLGTSFEWGGAWVQMPPVNTFSRNVNPINFSHILWNVKVWEKTQHTSILERDKALESTGKYEKMYSWSQSHVGNWDCLPFCWF